MLDASVDACDDAATASCDNAVAIELVDDAADEAAADCPTAAFGDVVCDPSKVVEAAPRGLAEETLVEIVKFEFAVVEKLDCAHEIK